MSVLELKTNGSVKINDREFTRLVGGFDEDKPMFLLWQAGDLLGLKTQEVRQNFERNENSFEEDTDFIDLKSLVLSSKTETIKTTEFLKSMGITHHKYGRAKRWLAFNFSGMMKLCYISDKIVDKNIIEFLNKYFYVDSKYFIKVNRKEQQFGKIIKGLFKNTLDVLPQYFVSGYMIDFYLPSVNLAVEYDEKNHKYQIEQDKIREENIKQELGCKFIRIEEGNEMHGLNKIIKHVVSNASKGEIMCVAPLN